MFGVKYILFSSLMGGVRISTDYHFFGPWDSRLTLIEITIIVKRNVQLKIHFAKSTLSNYPNALIDSYFILTKIIFKVTFFASFS